MTYVLDASAVLAILFNEPGAAVVAGAIEDGVLVSSVNISEVVAKMIERGAPDGLTQNQIAFLSLEVRDFSEADGFAAGFLRRQTEPFGLSFGDRACLALAQRAGLSALTADRSWQRLELPGLQVELMR